MALYN